MKTVSLILLLISCSLVHSQEFVRIEDSLIVYNLRLGSACDSSNLILNKTDQLPNSYDYLENNNFCYSISPITSNITYSFSFIASRSSTVIINAGYSILSCVSTVFNSVVLYDNNTCEIVGEGFIFSVQEGHVYTWTINASTSGIFCQGFSTICPYWLDIGPLVVELTLFEATVYNGYVDINWITASETNSHYFTLYRSDGFTDFKPIDKIDAAGYSNSIKEYNYRDNSPLEGNIYYKLVETDLNGIKHEYNIINVYNPYRLEFQVYDQFGRPTDLNTRGFKIIRYENGSVNCKFIINN
jgi:hypothetical protein